MEKTQNWFTISTTYAFGVAVGDVDADGTKEIVTVGHYYNSTTYRYRAQLRIWNWDGSVLTMEKSEEWMFTLNQNTYGRDVAIEDVDGDGAKEIITAGYAYDGTRYNGQLRIWNWDGTTLTLEKSEEWYATAPTYGTTYVYAVTVGDVDGDGANEIITGGQTREPFDGTTNTRNVAQLRIWNWDGSALNLEKTQEWYYTAYKYGTTEVYDVAVDDADGDGVTEILTVGETYDGKWDWGQLRIWSWNAGILNLEKSHEWISQIDLVYVEEYTYGVATGDVDSDGTKEIVTVGYLNEDYNGDDYATLYIWSWDGASLSEEKGKAFYALGLPETEFHGVTINDVDADGTTEIIAAGRLYDGDNNGYLAIFSTVNVYTTISVSVNPSNSTIGSPVTISGTVANQSDAAPVSGATVSLEYSTGATYTSVGSETTDSNGNYKFMWTPPATGSYTIRVSWPGDEEHIGATNTTSLTVIKEPSFISVAISSQTDKVNENVTVNGMIYPAHAATVTLNYTKPDGTSTTKNVTSTSAGGFNDTLTLNQAGTWTIIASWTGDDIYEGAVSTMKTIEAKEEVVEPPTFTYATVALGIGAIALLLAVIAIFLTTRKRGS